MGLSHSLRPSDRHITMPISDSVQGWQQTPVDVLLLNSLMGFDNSLKTLFEAKLSNP